MRRLFSTTKNILFRSVTSAQESAGAAPNVSSNVLRARISVEVRGFFERVNAEEEAQRKDGGAEKYTAGHLRGRLE
jgi:hypothetical protein